jgi:hypothetical protein
MYPARRDKQRGVLIMVVAAIAFFTCFLLFNQAGTPIQYTNLSYMAKMILTDVFLPVGLYFGLYYYSGRRLAAQVGGGLALFLVVAYLVGLIAHH